MPTLRLSTGRTVSPLERPKIAGVRDLVFDEAPVIRFPKRDEIILLMSGESQHIPILLQTNLLLDFSHIRLSKPDHAPAPVQFESAGPFDDRIKEFAAPVFLGQRLSPQSQRPADGPAALLRSYTPKLDRTGWLAEGLPSEIDLLLPILNPSLLADGNADDLLPHPLSNAHWEATHALLNRDALLLADELGTGKAVSTLLALKILFQSGKARRALLVAPNTEFRHWCGLLMQWTPELLCTVVRGEQALRHLDWGTPAHVQIVDYSTLAEDIENGHLPSNASSFDVIILDHILTVHYQAQKIAAALNRLKSEKRWALAGAIPRESEDWLAAFGMLVPEEAKAVQGDTLPGIKSRLQPHVLRRTKADLKLELPPRSRREIWLDLDPHQARLYGEALAEERYRLSRLGNALTKTHISTAVGRLKKICNFDPETFDSVKVRALVELAEDVTAADSKLVVFSQFIEDGIDRLHPVLEAYGALRLDTSTEEARRREVMHAFRNDELWHILLLELGARTDHEPLPQVSYIVHFDLTWNPAVRHRAESRLHPTLGPGTPINVYEFWVADTLDERLHGILLERGLLAGQVPSDTQPADLEERLSVEDWMKYVFDVTREQRPARRVVASTPGTGALAGTALLRARLSDLPPQELMAEIVELMGGLGYPNADILGDPHEGGGDVIAWREVGGIIERVLVRCVRSDENVGVKEGRRLLRAVEGRVDYLGGYLVTTGDFTASCKKLADESEGRLALVSGSELHRHLRILGRL